MMRGWKTDNRDKLHLGKLAIGQELLVKWDTKIKCYNRKQSNSLRNNVRQYGRKHNKVFEVTRHMAGLFIKRLE